jgi:hypothetical protein
MYPRNGKTPELLLAAADQAMYRAKREGGRKLAFHNSALTTTAGHTKPPRLGPSGPKITGISPVKSTAPIA